jgi:HlyD family secretion protein
MVNRTGGGNVTKFIAGGLALVVWAMVSAGCGANTATQEVWGRAEAKEVDINSKIPGRVVVLLVKEGDQVEKGQVLARIDDRDLVAQADQAKASINALASQTSQAVTQTQLADQTTLTTLDTAKAQLGKAKADLALAASDYERFSQLLASGAVSRQMFDTYQAKYQVAQATSAEAQAAVAAAQANLLQSRVSRDNVDVLSSKKIQAQAALAELDVALDETVIRAPFAGIVTAKYVEEGAMISTGMPLVAIQDPLDNWVNLKVKETELGKYSLHQTLRLQGRDGSLTVQGTIVDISKKSEFATYRATNERGDDDIITFNVKIQVNSAKVRPGMRFRLIDGDS